MMFETMQRRSTQAAVSLLVGVGVNFGSNALLGDPQRLADRGQLSAEKVEHTKTANNIGTIVISGITSLSLLAVFPELVGRKPDGIPIEDEEPEFLLHFGPDAEYADHVLEAA